MESLAVHFIFFFIQQGSQLSDMERKCNVGKSGFATRFVADQDGNPEGRCSHDTAHFISVTAAFEVRTQHGWRPRPEVRLWHALARG